MKGDLVVVVADGGIEQAVRGMLSRPRALGIRSLQGVEYPKLHKLDQGSFESGHELAELYRTTHEHALIIFDFDWEGRPTDDPNVMVEQVEAKLDRTWGGRGRCVVIDPELEVWIWSDSPHVAKALGWERMSELRQWLELRELWPPAVPKPTDPKQAYEQAIREKRVQKSNATFLKLAQSVSFERCNDHSFQRLVGILRGWFGASDADLSSAGQNA